MSFVFLERKHISIYPTSSTKRLLSLFFCPLSPLLHSLINIQYSFISCVYKRTLRHTNYVRKTSFHCKLYVSTVDTHTHCNWCGFWFCLSAWAQIVREKLYCNTHRAHCIFYCFDSACCWAKFLLPPFKHKLTPSPSTVRKSELKQSFIFVARHKLCVIM